MRGELRSLLSVSSLYAKEPVDCLRRRIICFWGDGEKIASSPPRSFKLAASCVSVAEREREKKKYTSKDPPATRSTAGSLQCVWWILLTIIVCRAAQRAPKSQGHQTSRLVLHLFLYIQCRQCLIYFTSDPSVTRILLQQLFVWQKKYVFDTVFFS